MKAFGASAVFEELGAGAMLGPEGVLAAAAVLPFIMLGKKIHNKR